MCLAAQQIDCSVVTMYSTLGDEAIKHIVNATSISSLIVDSSSIKKIIEMKEANELEKLEVVISIQKVSDELKI